MIALWWYLFQRALLRFALEWRRYWEDMARWKPQRGRRVVA